MSLSDDQVVNFIIARYKRQGINVSGILSDPTFKSLPINSKIEAIKRNAEAMSHNRPASAVDWGNIGSDAALGAFSGAIAAPIAVAKSVPVGRSLPGMMTKNKAMLYTALGAAGAGAILGAASGYVGGIVDQSKRQALSRDLAALRSDPTDQNAVNVMLSGDVHERSHSRSSGILRRVSDLIRSKGDSNIEGQSVREFDRGYNPERYVRAPG